MNLLGVILIGAISYEGVVQVAEISERHHYWKIARKYCDGVGKPLLRIGVRRSPLEPPNGDTTLDIAKVILKIPGGVWGDERAMPFEDKEFGVCFNEHTLEHLKTVEDVELAVNECVRVADKAILLCPSPYSIWATLFCPLHNLRLWFGENKIRVEQNRYRTGLGPPAPSAIGQVMILENELPEFVSSKKGFILDSNTIQGM